MMHWEEAMSCLLVNRKLVESAVLHAIAVALDRTDVTETTALSAPPPKGLGLTGPAKQAIYFPIEKIVKANGCALKKLTPNKLSSASTVKDLIDRVCKDLGVKS